MRRLKKRRLLLRDQIARLEAELDPRNPRERPPTRRRDDRRCSDAVARRVRVLRGALARADSRLRRARGAAEMALGRRRRRSRRAAALVVEAGTGVGKTFAYLVPALLSRRARARQHRHQDPAGPALPARPAAAARRARPAGRDRAAQGPRQLPVPAPHGAGAPAARACPTARGAHAGQGRAVGAARRAAATSPSSPGLDERSPRDPAGHLDARELPGQRVPEVPQLPRR